MTQSKQCILDPDQTSLLFYLLVNLIATFYLLVNLIATFYLLVFDCSV